MASNTKVIACMHGNDTNVSCLVCGRYEWCDGIDFEVVENFNKTLTKFRTSAAFMDSVSMKVLIQHVLAIHHERRWVEIMRKERQGTNYIRWAASCHTMRGVANASYFIRTG